MSKSRTVTGTCISRYVVALFLSVLFESPSVKAVCMEMQAVELPGGCSIRKPPFVSAGVGSEDFEALLFRLLPGPC